MKKLLLILPLLVLFSCNNTTTDESKSNKGLTNESKSDKVTTKIDTIWNDTVQDTFFGTKFGATLEEVNKNFAMYQALYSDTITKNGASERPYRYLLYGEVPGNLTFNNIYFAGIDWDYVIVYFYHKRFSAISFYTMEKTIDYERLERLISQKYKLTRIEPVEDGIISKKIAFGKNRCKLELTHLDEFVKPRTDIYNNEYNIILEYITNSTRSDEEILDEI